MRWSFLQAPHEGAHLQHLVLRHAPPGKRLHGPGGAAVENLEHADIGRGALVFPRIRDERRSDPPGPVRQMAGLALHPIELLAFGEGLLVAEIGVLAGLLEALHRLGLDLVRTRLHLEGGIVEHVPEDDRLRHGSRPERYARNAQSDQPQSARHHVTLLQIRSTPATGPLPYEAARRLSVPTSRRPSPPRPRSG